MSLNQESGSGNAAGGAAAAAGGCTPPAAVDAPRLVTRGETHSPDIAASPSAALIDWLAFTISPTPLIGDAFSWVKNALQTTFGISPNQYRPRSNGWYGYKYSVDLGGFGILAYGGEAQLGTYHIELNAKGCSYIFDWQAVSDWGDQNGVTITRVDLAHDDFQGDKLSIEVAVEWLNAGGFNSTGREPQSSVAGDWIRKRKGRTLYVGSREAGKMARIYEKGKQLGDLDGLLCRWTRAEVELRNKGRVVPWDVLTRPGQYLAGAYPCLRYLDTHQERLRTTQRAASVSYEAMVKHLRTVGGKAINVMLEVEYGDSGAVVTQLMKPGRPKRLEGYPTEVVNNLGNPAP